MGKHYRLAIYLCAYDPYKDLFDIFINQFKKNWSDCPYPLIVANMHFKYEGKNTIVINCGDEKDACIRRKRAIEAVDADYYLGFEEDRIIMAPVDTNEVEKILDFMDSENISYFRCNTSRFKKKKEDKFEGYEHYYHIPANEPYGVCGSTVIWKKSMFEEREKMGLENGYSWEAYQNKRAALTKEKWLPNNYSTDDRNLFHILHCVEKQKWIASSRKKLIKEGYEIAGRKVQTPFQTIISYLKNLFKSIPGKTRYRIKKILKKIGFKFSTDY